MDMPVEDNGWNEWSRYVLKELTRLGDCYSGLLETVSGIRNELSVLKVQAGIWGAIAGAIPAAVAVLYIMLKGR